MAQRPERSSASADTGSEEPADLHGDVEPLVPSTSTAGADTHRGMRATEITVAAKKEKRRSRKSLAVQRTRPRDLPVTYSAARLQTERGVVELPAPPGNIHVAASAVSGAVTGVNYDMSTRHEHFYHVERGYLTGGAVRELTRQLRSASHHAVRPGSTSGNEAARITRMLMPGTSSAAMSELGPVADEGDETDFTFPSALLDCKINALKEDFVETTFFRDLEQRLLDQGVAVVVGPTGEGKSSNAIMLCHRLRSEGYLSTYFESLDEIDTESIARYKRNLCVVIDNVFGTSILDTANLGRRSRVLSNLIAVQTAGRQGGGQGAREEGGSCGKKSLLLLLLSRDNVFTEALDKATQLPSIVKDESSRVCMKSADYLRKAEKKKLLKKYSGKIGRIPSEEEENAILSSNAPIGFPQVCRLYHELQTFHDKPIEFFSKPTALLLDTLKEMMREDAMVRAALALLVLQGGSVPLQILQLPEKREACGINAALQIIQKGLGCLHSEGDDIQKLLKTFETLCGCLLTQERGRVSFSHDSVRDAVCVVIADTSPPFVAEHFSLSVLSQCILLDDSSTSYFCQIQNQSVLAVPRGMWPLFTKRLVSELEKGKLRGVFTCNLMSNPLFCRELAAQLVPDIVHGVDVDCGLSFSFWASMAAPNFLKFLLDSCKFEKWEVWQGIIGCCINGHSDLIKSMHKSLQNDCVEDWSISICSWFGKGHNKVGQKLESRFSGRPSSTWCTWENSPVGRHAIPGTVAAEHGHISVLKTLVELGMPVDVRDPEQCTPLMSACCSGQKEVIAYLVTSHKADLTAADSRGSTPLHKLAEGGHDDIACWLVETHMVDNVLNETINKANEELQTPVMLACRYATKFARLLLAKGADMRKEEKQKKSCLHFAAEAGEPGLLQKLVDLKAMDVNQLSRSGWSPLHFACSRPNNLEAVQMLLRQGAEVKPIDKISTETPVHVAVRQGCLETVQALVESGSDVLAACESINTTSPFLLACEKGNVEVVQYLHRRKVDVFRKDACQQSALHFAARSGSIDTVQYVMTHVDLPVEVRSNTGMTPLLIACESGKMEVVKYLRESKADLSVVDNDANTTLLWAARSGNVDTVQYVLDETGMSVNTRNKSGHTPLLLACMSGRVEVVRYLRERQADAVVVDNDGHTALHLASCSGNVDTVQYVMDETGVNVNTRNKSGMTPLLLACLNGRVEVVRYLSARKADIADVDSDGHTVLHWAAWSGNVDTVQYVMDETRLNVNKRNKFGKTPLLIACENGRVEVVKYLKERKADTAVVDNDGHTALHWAAWSGNVDTVQYVMDETGVNVNTRDKSGMTPLLLACLNGKVGVVKYLKERMADTAVVDNDGDTALHLASCSGNVDTVQYVMDETGLNVNTRNKSGMIPLLLACGNGRVEVVKYLRERKADTAVEDNDGNTALHLAAWSGNVDTVQYMMDKTDVNVNRRNKCGKTPLLLACENGRVEVVKYLRERKAETAVVDNNRHTALHWAAMSGNVDTVQYLMDETGMNVNTRSKSGMTPLLLACLNGRVEVVKYLRERQADAAVVDNDGDTVLHLAAMSGRVDTVQYVMDEMNISVNAKNKYGRTPLLLASLNGKVEIVKYLRERKADTVVVDNYSYTALHLAAVSGNVKTVQYVMDGTGLNVNIRNKLGKTPLLIACENGRVEVVKYLKERMADTAVADNNGYTALHWAAWSGNVDTVQYVMDETGMSVNTRNKSGQTPLLLACENGRVEVVKYLRERKADTAVVDNDGDSALHLAAWSGNVDTVQYVMDETGVNVNTRDKSGMTPLLAACENGSVEIVRYLSERKADTAVVDNNGHTALHWAAGRGNVDTVQYVMDETGVNVNTRDKFGKTPLLLACENGSVEIVRYLSERKADTAVVDNDGYTALHCAAWSGNVDTVQYIMDVTGANMNIRNKTGRTPLLLACLNGRVEAVRYLSERKADIAAVDKNCSSALHFAAWSGNVDTVQYVMDVTGANMNIRNKTGRTPLLLACEKGSVEVVKYLSERKADTAVVDNDGNTALHFAASSGDVDTVQYVMDETGVNVNVRDMSGMTPFLVACVKGRVEILKYLKERMADTAVVDNDGNTALHWAAMSGNVDTVQYVMDETGVNVNRRNKSGKTPLLLACLKGRMEVVRYLKERKVDTAVVDNDGYTVLHCAAWSGNVDTMQYVMDETGVILNTTNKFGQTPLLIACASGRVDIVKCLRERQADTAVVDIDGDTALHSAAGSGDMDTVRYLVEDAAMKADSENFTGETPLSLALEAGHAAVRDYLSEKTQHLEDQGGPGGETRGRRIPQCVQQ